MQINEEDIADKVFEIVTINGFLLNLGPGSSKSEIVPN